MYPKIHCCVFEESGDPERHKSHVDDLDTHNAVFLDQLKRVAFADGMNIHYSHISHPPIHANDEEMEAAVNASRFDADYVINMYPRLNDIGPELGHQILSRRKRYCHVFVVTHNKIYEATLLRGLSAITQNAGKSKKDLLFTFLESSDAEDARVLSFWHVESTRDEYVRRRLLSVFSST